MNNDKKKIILTGIRPTAKLHIGNYLGTLQKWPDYVSQYECFFMIADLHSLTDYYNPSEKKAQIINLAAEILATGIDIDKCTFFRQSDMPEHTELAWYFNCLTPISFLERMTQFKDKSKERNTDQINAGLFDYPVLQAADILIYNADIVPVGYDQVQHVELARDISKFFNNRFGKIFKSPKPLLTKVPKVMSLTNPDKKMSKSHGEKSCIYLTDKPEEIASKIKKAVTTAQGLENLYFLAEIFMKNFKRDDYKDKNEKLKEDLSENIASNLKPIREKIKSLNDDPAQIIDILKKGSSKARIAANKKLLEVKEKMGLLL